MIATDKTKINITMIATDKTKINITRNGFIKNVH
jgi:hypothetical protein